MKATLYPTKISVEKDNESSGLAGTCFKEVRRDKSVHNVNCKDQKDPKYFHKWTNEDNLKKKDGVAQCGQRSSYHCSHSTYYGIKGYRNTCPIAGVTGTYTQPAPLKLSFNPKAKDILAGDKIKSVTVSISHRCTGVDVATDKEYDTWGPNFSGFKTYPNRKVLKIKFAGETKEIETNPPLSKKNYNTKTVKFTKVRYSDLADGVLELKYGNNLSTNPGNIYIKNVCLEVEYEHGVAYLSGKQSTKQVITSEDGKCSSKIIFEVEAGYKSGNEKIAVNKAPKNLQNLIQIEKKPSSLVQVGNITYKQDKRTTVFTFIDKSGKATTTNKISFKVKDTNLKKEFIYSTKLPSLPAIEIPASIQHNIKPNGVPPITINGGCSSSIKIYNESILSDPLYTLNSIDITDETSNAIYTEFARLSCGYHNIIFQMDDGRTITKTIKIIPPDYQIILTKNREIVSEIVSYEHKTNKTTVTLYNLTENFIEEPTFTIINPTFIEENGKPKQMESETWKYEDLVPCENEPCPRGKQIELGRFVPGNYKLQIKADCPSVVKEFNIKIKPEHKQRFDKIFVQGNNSTAFDYDYLVAWEGDTLTTPLFVEKMKHGASFSDFRVCTTEKNISGISGIGTIPMKVTNTSSERTIENLMLEINVLVENEDGELEVTTSEWLEESGLFHNIKENFEEYNPLEKDRVSIKNLSKDDDFYDIEEEDVYIHLRKINPNETIAFDIPFNSYLEKNVYLQILVFGESILLYDKDGCNNNDTSFDLIQITTNDAILTNMEIFGDIDILETENDPSSCPLEYFDTKEGVTYKITNIDSSDVSGVSVKIKNDARLKPYKIKYGEDETDITPQTTTLFDSRIEYKSEERTKSYVATGLQVTNKIAWAENDLETLTGYTDSNGFVTFFVENPKRYGKTLTIDDLYKLCTVETPYNTTTYWAKNTITYNPGEVIPVKIKVELNEIEKVEEFTFEPDISTPQTSDEVTIFYKVYNLKNNEGILKTTFETDSNDLVPNKVEEDLLFGVDTDLELISKLEKVIVEQNTYNRLYLMVQNRKRFNKDIKITIKEQPETEKYQYAFSDVDAGKVTQEDNKIIWSIPSLERNTIVKGYIDLKGANIGLSDIIIEKEDFLDSQNINFNEYKCPCRREIE